MEKKDLLVTLRAVEFLFKGVDITPLVYDDFKKYVDSSGKLVEDFTGPFVIQLSDEVEKFLNLYYPFVTQAVDNYKYFKNVSEDSLKEMKRTSDVLLEYDNLLATMQILYKTGVCKYVGVDRDLLDKDLQQKMQTIKASWDYTQDYSCDIKKTLTREVQDKEIKTLLALCQYPEGLASKIYDYFKVDHEFVLRKFRDFKVTDNRIYIPLSEADKYEIQKAYQGSLQYTEADICKVDAIVISKNPADYFYCSYGNKFQSCFSLNSSMSCWYGYVPYSTAPESFMIYATSGSALKTTVTSSGKFHSPQMFWRAWGYASSRGDLIVDKKYRANDRSADKLIEWCCGFLTSKFGAICDGPHRSKTTRALYQKGTNIYNIWSQYSLRFYSDSLRRDKDVNVNFRYGSGESIDSRYAAPWTRKFDTFIVYASTVNSVSDTLDLDKPVKINAAGHLFNPKVCPVTGLEIDETEDKHFYSKFLSHPVKNLLPVFYHDGFVFYDYITEPKRNDAGYIKVSSRYSPDFSSGCLFIGSLKEGCMHPVKLSSLKEFIKGNIDKSLPDYDAILLKYIDKDRVIHQVFYKKGK